MTIIHPKFLLGSIFGALCTLIVTKFYGDLVNNRMTTVVRPRQNKQTPHHSASMDTTNNVTTIRSLQSELEAEYDINQAVPTLIKGESFMIQKVDEIKVGDMCYEPDERMGSVSRCIGLTTGVKVGVSLQSCDIRASEQFWMHDQKSRIYTYLGTEKKCLIGGGTKTELDIGDCTGDDKENTYWGYDALTSSMSLKKRKYPFLTAKDGASELQLGQKQGKYRDQKWYLNYWSGERFASTYFKDLKLNNFPSSSITLNKNTGTAMVELTVDMTGSCTVGCPNCVKVVKIVLFDPNGNRVDETCPVSHTGSDCAFRAFYNDYNIDTSILGEWQVHAEAAWAFCSTSDIPSIGVLATIIVA